MHGIIRLGIRIGNRIGDTCVRVCEHLLCGGNRGLRHLNRLRRRSRLKSFERRLGSLHRRLRLRKLRLEATRVEFFEHGACAHAIARILIDRRDRAAGRE